MNEAKKGFRDKKHRVAHVEPNRPRNFVAKNAVMGGAGAHKDKKKAQKQGDVKHKKVDYAESLQAKLDLLLTEAERNPDLMSPGDYDRYQQGQMDYARKSFKQREIGQELSHEETGYYQVMIARNGKWDYAKAQPRKQGMNPAMDIIRNLHSKYPGMQLGMMWPDGHIENFGKGKRTKDVEEGGTEGKVEIKLDSSVKHIRELLYNWDKEYDVQKFLDWARDSGADTIKNAIKLGTKANWRDPSMERQYPGAEDGWERLSDIVQYNPYTDKGVAEGIKEDSKRCPQCGSTDCTCPPGKCKCTPMPGWTPKSVDENKVDEFLPALGMVAGRALAGAAGAGRMASMAAGMAGRAVGSAVDNAINGDDTEEDFDNPEYNDEAGMAQNTLSTISRAVHGLQKSIDQGDNLPEWCQEKIAKCEQMLVTVWDYLQSQKEQGIEPKIDEKLNLKAMDTGDVIKDFEKSNAPQFRGKTKEKRRQMAIAAKMGAMNPKKKKAKRKAHESWTTDTLAAQLFEQELTYEDKLNSLLAKKLSK